MQTVQYLVAGIPSFVCRDSGNLAPGTEGGSIQHCTQGGKSTWKPSWEPLVLPVTTPQPSSHSDYDYHTLLQFSSVWCWLCLPIPEKQTKILALGLRTIQPCRSMVRVVIFSQSTYLASSAFALAFCADSVDCLGMKDLWFIQTYWPTNYIIKVARLWQFLGGNVCDWIV